MKPKKTVNIGLIGYRFMGKAHSNAWIKAPYFFGGNLKPLLKVACGRHAEPLREFADNWGWEEIETDWRKVVAREDVDIVDISAPTHLHFEIAMEAAKAGKPIFCEKPFTLNAKQARELCEFVEERGVLHYLNHNYRRCPAVAFARKLIEEGRLGRIFHWRGAYLQSWIVDPDFPLIWQLRQETAGGGPHMDLNSHSVDLARFLVGEIKSVTAMMTQFVPERPIPDESASGAFQGATKGGTKGRVTVDDASFMLAEFENGALGSFEASRFAPGRKNYNLFEIYGDRGSLAFNLERMNELRYFSSDDPACSQGFRTILTTEPDHPYVGNWWPPGHNIGYEHTIIHAMADFLKALETGGRVTPDFHDGVRILELLDAAVESAKTGKKVTLQS
jgi:predicted dehydrogenase